MIMDERKAVIRSHGYVVYALFYLLTHDARNVVPASGGYFAQICRCQSRDGTAPLRSVFDSLSLPVSV
jgi:hypothetical protein